ncbi:MAG: 50S ribosomal protein L11 methyltransferase [Verrucomicrobiales bacterium]|nr:50S ribosomal protein L11 methyltransferase [Verrucomicrobiales bacterium]
MPRSTRTAPLHALTVTTSVEAAEAVAELLLRLTRESPITTHDRIRGECRVAVYVASSDFLDADRRRRLRDGLAAIRACGLDVGAGRVSWKRVKAADWTESWKRHFRPLIVGKQLLIRPSWSRRRPGRGQQELVLDPGLSFGTGQHATTGFCLAEIVRLRPRSGPAALLDVGTGSGILALAAARLGYAPVRGFDFDPEAVRVARENADLNGLADRVRLVRGDVSRLPARPGKRYEVVVANLTADLLEKHAPLLLAQGKPGSALVLAGILAEEFDRVRDRFESLGARPMRSKRQREWRSGSFRL